MAERSSAPQVLINCIVPSTWDENLHVLPASPLLESAERELIGVAGAPYRLADPVEPRYLETVGLMSVINKINEVREGWRHPNLHIRGILVTKLDMRVRGHKNLLEELKAQSGTGQTDLRRNPCQ